MESDCFSLKREAGFRCCLSSDFLGVYNCLLTLTKRSAERKSAQARFYGFCCFSTVKISK